MTSTSQPGLREAEETLPPTRSHSLLERFWADPALQALVLCLAALLVFIRVASFDFVNYDDPDYLYDNPHVSTGLTWQNTQWAFSTLNGGISYWHPVTWLSHQLDCTLFGLKPGAHHLTSLWLHLANAVILLLALRQLRLGSRLCFFVAAFFLLHPLHVESVAWIAERKDVLYGFFWIGALATYTRFRIVAGLGWYWISLALLVCGLMSKPTAVTLPAVLLALELTLLRKLCDKRQNGSARLWPIIRRLAPFAGFSCVACILVIVAQRDLGALPGLSELSVSDRLDSALFGFAFYCRKALVPVGLCACYVATQSHGFLQFLLAALLLVAGCAACWRARRSAPLILFGWAWFILTLLPNSGLIQAGPQSVADRYTYIPLIGLTLVAAESGHGLVRRIGHSGFFVCGAGLLVILCGMLSFAQLRYWRNGLALFERAVEVDPRNWVARLGLGMALVQERRYSEAVEQLEQASALPGNRFETEWRLGVCFKVQGDRTNALAHFYRAEALRPGSPRTRRLIQEALQSNPNAAASAGPPSLSSDPHF